jgi:hypothetical protein
MTIRTSGHVVLVMLALAAPAEASEPARGTRKTLPVVSVVLNVGSTEKETRRVVYAPPPGWYVRSHEVRCVKKYGAASYTVNTVPAGWDWESDEAAGEAARASATVGASVPTARAGGEAAAASDAAQTARQHVAASHHALVVEVAARGGGWFRGGAGVELTVLAELVYLGRD